MRLERGQVHLDVEHSLDESGNLRAGQIWKACNKEGRNMFPKESGVGLAWWLRRWVE